jgi:tRNA (adenine22-N1)-methyltransferase
METLKLSPRLAAVASFVPQGAVIADVGTDHAYLPAYLLLAGRITPPAYAFDINEGPVESARRTAEKYGLADKMEIRLNNGLAGTRETLADTVIIAGMGGENIADIIERSLWRWNDRHTLVLQPMSKAYELCRWLYDNGFYIAEETKVKDGGELYRVLCVKHGHRPPPDALELYTGPVRAGEELELEYLKKISRKLEKAAEGLGAAKNTQPERYERLTKLAQQAKNRLEELKR